MTLVTFSPLDMTFSSDFYTIKSAPRQQTDKKTGKAKPLAYEAFSLGVPAGFINAYAMPSWDTSKYFLNSILDAIREQAIEARTSKKPGVDLGENLPAFLASLSVGGRILKADLTSWLAAVNSIIGAYVAEKYPDDDALQVAAKVAKLAEWLGKAAMPVPGWNANQYRSLVALTNSLSEVAEVSEKGEFPNAALLESIIRKLEANKPTTDEAI